MRNFVNRMVVLFIVATITSAAAFAKTSRKEVTFSEAVTLNGVLVKRGTYEVSFDDETNQLTIAKGGKIVAQAKAQLTKGDGIRHAAYESRYETNDETKPPALIMIALKGGNQASIENKGD